MSNNNINGLNPTNSQIFKETIKLRKQKSRSLHVEEKIPTNLNNEDNKLKFRDRQKSKSLPKKLDQPPSERPILRKIKGGTLNKQALKIIQDKFKNIEIINEKENELNTKSKSLKDNLVVSTSNSKSKSTSKSSSDSDESPSSSTQQSSARLKKSLRSRSKTPVRSKTPGSKLSKSSNEKISKHISKIDLNVNNLKNDEIENKFSTLSITRSNKSYGIRKRPDKHNSNRNLNFNDLKNGQTENESPNLSITKSNTQKYKRKSFNGSHKLSPKEKNNDFIVDLPVIKRNSDENVKLDESRSLSPPSSPTNISYVEHLEKLQEEKSLELGEFYDFLLSVENEALRKDFAKAACWMDFFKEDLELETPLLVIKMLEIYNYCDYKNMKTRIELGEKFDRKENDLKFKQKEIISSFVTDLINRQILTKEQVLTKEPIREDSFDSIMYQEKIISSKIECKRIALEIDYDIKNKRIKGEKNILTSTLRKIARGKFKGNYEEFIDALANDIKNYTLNILERIHHTEFYHCQWQKKPENAPNITHYTDSYNRLSDFFIGQILRWNEKKRGKRIFSFAVRLASRLVEIGDYSSAIAIYSACVSLHVSRLYSPEKMSQLDRDKFNKLQSLFAPHRKYEALRNHIKNNKLISYVPYLGGIHFRDFIHADENGQVDENNKINFGRLQIMAKMHQVFEDERNSIIKLRNLEIAEDLYKNLEDDRLVAGQPLSDLIEIEKKKKSLTYDLNCGMTILSPTENDRDERLEEIKKFNNLIKENK